MLLEIDFVADLFQIKYPHALLFVFLVRGEHVAIIFEFSNGPAKL